MIQWEKISGQDSHIISDALKMNVYILQPILCPNSLQSSVKWTYFIWFAVEIPQ